MNNFSKFIQTEFQKMCVSHITFVVFIKIKVNKNGFLRENKKILKILILPKIINHFKVHAKYS